MCYIFINIYIISTIFHNYKITIALKMIKKNFKLLKNIKLTFNYFPYTKVYNIIILFIKFIKRHF